MHTLILWIALVLYVSGLVLAMAGDLRERRIPNWLCAILAALFLPAGQAAGLGWQAFLVDHVSTGLAVLGIGLVLFSRGWLGGGDVKLLAAVSLWVGAPNLFPLLIIMSVLGGLLALGVLIAHRWRGTSKEVPYGLAIGGAALWLLPRLDTLPPDLVQLFR